MLDDGTAGLLAIKLRRGVTIVQDPEEAIHNSMPLNGIRHVEVDHILPISAMATVLERLARDPVSEDEPPGLVSEPELAARITDCYLAGLEGEETPPLPDALTCSKCGGMLRELRLGDLPRYECPMGHVFSRDSLRISQSETLEIARANMQRVVREQTAVADKEAPAEPSAGTTVASAWHGPRPESADPAALLERLQSYYRNGGSPEPSIVEEEWSELQAVNYGARGDVPER
jgi:two-component system chemotaxis response regulator CheB